MRRPGPTVSSEKRHRYEQGMGLSFGKRGGVKWKLPKLQELLLGITCLMVVFLIMSLTYSSTSNVQDSNSVLNTNNELIGDASVNRKQQILGEVSNKLNRTRSFQDGIVTHGHRHNNHHHHSTNAHEVHVDEAYKGNIYMDWMLPSDYFDYINYKSLESLLQVYPNAKSKT